MPAPQDLYKMLLAAAPLLLSLTVHEYAHARTALAFGDDTARRQGRVTLNPLAHLDPIGTLVLVLSQFIGWARPVPVNPNNLHPRRLGDIAVSLAGPMSNLGLAILCGLGLRLMLAIVGAPQNDVGRYTYLVLFITMMANLGLFMFNMLPLFPLDGHHIAREILPTHDQQQRFMQWQTRFGMVILLALIFLPAVLSRVMERSVFDPIGWLYMHLASFALRTFGLEEALWHVQPFLL